MAQSLTSFQSQFMPLLEKTKIELSVACECLDSRCLHPPTPPRVLLRYLLQMLFLLKTKRRYLYLSSQSLYFLTRFV